MDSNKNIRGGKGYKKRKTRREVNKPKQNNALNVEEGDGYYARAKKVLMGNQVEVTLSNGTTETVAIPGRMYKKQWIKPGMLLLINTENEIVKIMREHDVDMRIASEMMGKAENTNSIFSNIYNNDDSESDNDDKLFDMNNEMNKLSVNKNTQHLQMSNDKNNNLMINPNRRYEKNKKTSKSSEESEEQGSNSSEESEEIEKSKDDETKQQEYKKDSLLIPKLSEKGANVKFNDMAIDNI